MKPNLSYALWERFRDRPITGTATMKCESEYDDTRYRSVLTIFLEFDNILAMNNYAIAAWTHLQSAGGKTQSFSMMPADGKADTISRKLTIIYQHTKEMEKDKK